MKILLDEMLTGSKEIYESLGWEVTITNDVGLNGKKDREVIQFARDHGCILVTRDELPFEIARIIGAKCFRITDAMIAEMTSNRMKQMQWDD